MASPTYVSYMFILFFSCASCFTFRNTSEISTESTSNDTVTRRRATSSERWSEEEIVRFLSQSSHSHRAYFSRLFRDGGFRSAVEVGVAGGRFAEHLILDGLRIQSYIMIEPYVQGILRHRCKTLSGKFPGMALNLVEKLSIDKQALDAVVQADFIYLDGAHDYQNVKLELEPYWERVAPGGILTGHDYCDYGQKRLACRGCSEVPRCGVYTEVNRNLEGRKVSSQHGVVRAVQEWLAESHPYIQVHHTTEGFSRQSLEADGMDYDLVLTKTRNPSWFVVKPATIS